MSIIAFLRSLWMELLPTFLYVTLRYCSIYSYHKTLPEELQESAPAGMLTSYQNAT